MGDASNKDPDLLRELANVLEMGSPLLAREIAAELNKRGLDVERGDVNQLLYRHAERFAKDEQHRWRVVATPGKAPAARDRATNLRGSMTPQLEKHSPGEPEKKYAWKHADIQWEDSPKTRDDDAAEVDRATQRSVRRQLLEEAIARSSAAKRVEGNPQPSKSEETPMGDFDPLTCAACKGRKQWKQIALDGVDRVERILRFGALGFKGFGEWKRSPEGPEPGIVCGTCGGSATEDLVLELRSQTGFSEQPCLFKDPKDVELAPIIDAIASAFEIRGPRSGQLVDKPRDGLFVDASVLNLAPTTLRALNTKLRGTSIYQHQARAIAHALQDGHLMLATATASGKSLCFQLPILDALVRATGEGPTALYLGPMKALVDDQFRSMQGFGIRVGPDPNEWPELARYLAHVSLDGGRTITLAQYHGGVKASTKDEEKALRKAIRNAQPNIVFATADMLSMPMLTQAKTSDVAKKPWDQYWSWFFERLRYIVLDECHELRGVYGSHVANILRRLRRTCALLENKEPLTYLLCSATVREPETFARELTGVEREWLTILPKDDTSQRHERRLVVVGRPTAGKPEPLAERARRIVDLAFARERLSTIYFEESIPAVQQLSIRMRRGLESDHKMRPGLFDVFASTFLSEDKTEKLAALREGKTKGVASTSALALGIDIGTLSCVVLGGYPGSMAKTWQMLGRAGRVGPGLLLFIEGDSYFDAFFADHPEELADPQRHLDELVIDPDNPEILKLHLRAAAEEHPIHADRDRRFFGPQFDVVLKRMLVDGDDIEEDSEWVTLKSSIKDAALIPLRGKTPTPVDVFRGSRSDANLLLQDRIERAIRTLYPGAIIVHDGAVYEVKEFRPMHRQRDDDDDEPTAFYAIAVESRRQEITIPVVATSILPVAGDDDDCHAVIGGCSVQYGKVAVTTRVDEFFRGPLDPNRPTEGAITVVKGMKPDAKRLGANFRRCAVNRTQGTPEEHTLRTDGAWIVIEDPVLVALDEDTRYRAVFTVGKAIERAIPHEHFAAPDDLEVVVVPSHPIAHGGTALFIHELTEPGAGLARRTFDGLRQIASVALHKVLEGCPKCSGDIDSKGCIRCVGDASGLHDRSLAIGVLKRWLDETEAPATSDEELLRSLGYRENQLLATGSQGRVYRSTLGGETFACKVARGHGHEAATALATEGIEQNKISKKYPSAAIVRLFDVHHAGEDVVLRFEMGTETLDERIGPTGYHPLKSGTKDPKARLQAVLEEIFPILEAIAVIHKQGTVHRDIKPANILLIGNGWKLGDFGIVHSAFEQGDRQTFGAHTPDYAPKWAKETRVGPDKKHDVYSAACVLSEMLLGERKRITAPAKVPSWIPKPLAQTLAAALADESTSIPFKDGSAFLDAIRRVAAG